jgi:hypothetical protein
MKRYCTYINILCSEKGTFIACSVNPYYSIFMKIKKINIKSARKAPKFIVYTYTVILTGRYDVS